MSKARITSVLEMLDALDALVKKKKKITLRNIMDAIGHRSFGPLLLFAGIILAAPGVGDIPGIPTATGIFIVLVTAQMVIKRSYVWLPRWLLERSVTNKRLGKTISWLRKPAGHLDKVVKKRLVGVTNGLGAMAIAIVCLAIGLATPLTEVVLFAANLAGAAIATFGLALVAHDGWLALLGFAAATAMLVVVLFAMN